MGLQAPCVPSRPWYNATKCSSPMRQGILQYGNDFDNQFAALKAVITGKSSVHGGFITTCMCHGCPWDKLVHGRVNAFAALGQWYYGVTSPGNASLYFDTRGPNADGQLNDPKYRDPGQVNWCWPGDGSFPKPPVV